MALYKCSQFSELAKLYRPLDCGTSSTALTRFSNLRVSMGAGLILAGENVVAAVTARQTCLSPVHTAPEEFENGTLFLRLGNALQTGGF